jgi:hypothetical protein
MRLRTAVVIGGLVGAFGAACSTRELTGDADPGVIERVVSGMRYTADGHIVLAGGATLAVFDGHLTPSARISLPLPPRAHPYYAELSADGSTGLVVASSLPYTRGDAPPAGTTSKLFADTYALPEGTMRSRVVLPFGMEGAALSPTGAQLAVYHFSATEPPELPHFVETYDVATGELSWWLRDVVDPIVFSPDGARLYVPKDNRAYVVGVDSETGEQQVSFRGQANSLALSHDGSRMILTGAGSASIWRTDDASSTLQFSEAANLTMFAPMAVAADGTSAGLSVPVLDDGAPYSLQVWEGTGPIRYHVPLPEPLVLDYWIAFSPDGTEIATASVAKIDGDARLHVFRAADGAMIADRTVTVAELRSQP